jgi:hypothetical protein
MAILDAEESPPSTARDDAAVMQPGPAASAANALTTAEAAECQCPDFCERDHDLD